MTLGLVVWTLFDECHDGSPVIEQIPPDMKPARLESLGLAAALFLLNCAALVLLTFAGFRVQFPEEGMALLYLLAIVLISLEGRLIVALLNTVLALLLFDYFFTPPIFTISPNDPMDWTAEFTFATAAVVVTTLISKLRKTQREVIQARDHLENEVAERTKELTQARDHLEVVNEELARRGTQLETSNKELEAFAYSVSHDLRAPLRHIAGFSELLRKKVSSTLNEEAQRYVASILESAERMGNLIDDLLAFSKVSRAEPKKNLVNLGQLVQEAVAEARRDIVDREIIWKIGELPNVNGDRSMLRLALVNLISNAVKFTRTRSAAEIEIGSINPGPGQVGLFIRDNGVGFNMAYQDKLFGVFQRLHPAQAFEGTGIGLATVQRIVLRHGGRVWAEGVVNGGATFYFSVSKSG